MGTNSLREQFAGTWQMDAFLRYIYYCYMDKNIFTQIFEGAIKGMTLDITTKDIFLVME